MLQENSQEQVDKMPVPSQPSISITKQTRTHVQHEAHAHQNRTARIAGAIFF